MNVGIVLAGGVGRRFGSDVPKQYQVINGKEVISYSINALKDSGVIDAVIVTAQRSFLEGLAEKYEVIPVLGGDTRNESLSNALRYVNDNFSCDNVIILEAARPMVTPKIVAQYISELGENDAVITGQKIVASLGCYHAHTVNRDDYYLIEAPEAFQFGLLYKNFDRNSKITATNQQLPATAKTKIVFDFTDNLKITYFADLKHCELLMDDRDEKI